jgi:intraflagellar transport protein 172
MSTGRKIVIRSESNAEIGKVDVQKERFFLGYTNSTVLVADLETNKVSEIPWRGSGQE